MKQLEGAVVLITGGNKGIGLQSALAFGQLGCRIYICGRDSRALEHALDMLHKADCTAFAVQTDVSDSEQCRTLIETIDQAERRLDILINNAGMSMRGTIESTEVSVIRRMIEINYLGACYLTHYSIPLIKRSQGSIVFISSLTALHGLPNVGPYGASKLALRNFAQSLQAELASAKVHVGIIHVGFTDFDEGKTLYAADGSLIALRRTKNHQSRQQVAHSIVRCVMSRKREMTLTWLGRLAYGIYRFFPRLSDTLVCHLAKSKDIVGS